MKKLCLLARLERRQAFHIIADMTGRVKSFDVLGSKHFIQVLKLFFA